MNIEPLTLRDCEGSAHGSDRSYPVHVTFEWCTEDPHAAKVTFKTRTDTAVWFMSVDLLTAGIYEPAGGEGDIALMPFAGAVAMVELTLSYRDAVSIRLHRGLLADWLDEVNTHRIPAERAAFAGIDDELSALLGEAA